VLNYVLIEDGAMDNTNDLEDAFPLGFWAKFLELQVVISQSPNNNTVLIVSSLSSTT